MKCLSVFANVTKFICGNSGVESLRPRLGTEHYSLYRSSHGSPIYPVLLLTCPHSPPLSIPIISPLGHHSNGERGITPSQSLPRLAPHTPQRSAFFLLPPRISSDHIFVL